MILGVEAPIANTFLPAQRHRDLVLMGSGHRAGVNREISGHSRAMSWGTIEGTRANRPSSATQSSHGTGPVAVLNGVARAHLQEPRFEDCGGAGGQLIDDHAMGDGVRLTAPGIFAIERLLLPRRQGLPRVGLGWPRLASSVNLGSFVTPSSDGMCSSCSAVTPLSSALPSHSSARSRSPRSRSSRRSAPAAARRRCPRCRLGEQLQPPFAVLAEHAVEAGEAHQLRIVRRPPGKLARRPRSPVETRSRRGRGRRPSGTRSRGSHQLAVVRGELGRALEHVGRARVVGLVKASVPSWE